MKLIESLFPNRAARRIAAMRARLYRSALAWCGNPQQADDLVQETMEKALKGLHRLQRPEALESWLFTILANCHRDHWRKRVPDEPMNEPLDEGAPAMDEVIESEQTVRRVRRAIDRLSPGQKEVLVLVDIEGFSYAEVAEILQLPIGTVMSRLNRGRQRLKLLLFEKGRSDLPKARNHLERVK